MIQLIQGVQDSIKLHLPPGEERTELLESHDLVIHDQLEKFDGARSHEVRDHFNEWWATQLPQGISRHRVFPISAFPKRVGVDRQNLTQL
jgi:hypothetical protein